MLNNSPYSSFCVCAMVLLARNTPLHAPQSSQYRYITFLKWKQRNKKCMREYNEIMWYWSNRWRFLNPTKGTLSSKRIYDVMYCASHGTVNLYKKCFSSILVHYQESFTFKLYLVFCQFHFLNLSQLLILLFLIPAICLSHYSNSVNKKVKKFPQIQKTRHGNITCTMYTSTM